MSWECFGSFVLENAKKEKVEKKVTKAKPTKLSWFRIETYLQYSFGGYLSNVIKIVFLGLFSIAMQTVLVEMFLGFTRDQTHGSVFILVYSIWRIP